MGPAWRAPPTVPRVTVLACRPSSGRGVAGRPCRFITVGRRTGTSRAGYGAGSANSPAYRDDLATTSGQVHDHRRVVGGAAAGPLLAIDERTGDALRERR